MIIEYNGISARVCPILVLYQVIYIILTPRHELKLIIHYYSHRHSRLCKFGDFTIWTQVYMWLI